MINFIIILHYVRISLYAADAHTKSALRGISPRAHMDLDQKSIFSRSQFFQIGDCDGLLLHRVAVANGDIAGGFGIEIHT